MKDLKFQGKDARENVFIGDLFITKAGEKDQLHLGKRKGWPSRISHPKQADGKTQVKGKKFPFSLLSQGTAGR